MTSERAVQQQARELLQGYFENPAICSWCFARKRSYHTDYEEEVAEHLTGRNTSALEARGHRVQDDGTLLVNSTATSDPDPSTFFEVVPPRTDERGSIIEPARAQTVCECGVIDYDPSDDRSTRELYGAIENITTRLSEQDTDFSERAAKEFISEASSHPELAGKDTDVLTRSVKLGLKHG